MDASLPASIIPASIAPPTEMWFLRPVRIVDRNLIPIKETGTARIALFRENHLNTHQFCLVGQHLDEPGMGDLHKVLVIPLAHLDCLFPERVSADNQRPDPLLYQ